MKYYTTNEPMQPIYSVDKPGFHQLIYKQYQLISRKHFIAYVCSTLEDSSYTSQVFIQQMGGKAGYPLLQISDQNATKFQQRQPKSPKLKKKIPGVHIPNHQGPVHFARLIVHPS